MGKAKVTVVINNKGGVGKSVSSTTLAAIFGVEMGSKTLFVDMDPQSNGSQILGFKGNAESHSLKEKIEQKLPLCKNTIEDVLLDMDKDIHDCIIKTRMENVDLLPSYLTLSNAENQLLSDVNYPQQFRLKMKLDKLADEYDYIIIDCGPGASLLNINALVASDTVLIPSRSDMNSRNGIANVMHLIQTVQLYNSYLELAGCFLTQFDSRKKICKEAWEDCQQALGDKFLPWTIGQNTNAEKGPGMERTLYELDKNSKAVEGYRWIAKYLVANNKKKVVKDYWRGIENEI